MISTWAVRRALLSVLLLCAGCGGKAVVDAPLGAGGDTAAASGSGGSTASGDRACPTVDPPASPLTGCTGTLGSDRCDETCTYGSELYEVVCAGDFCTCYRNRAEVCTCVASDPCPPQNQVDPLIEHCCPPPWQRPDD